MEQVDVLTASSSPSGDSASRQQAHPAPGTYQRSTMPEVMILGLAGIAFVVALFILLWSGFNDAIGSQAGLLVGSFVLTSGFLVMSWALYRRALSEQDTAVTLDRERRQETAALDRLNLSATNNPARRASTFCWPANRIGNCMPLRGALNCPLD